MNHNRPTQRPRSRQPRTARPTEQAPTPKPSEVPWQEQWEVWKEISRDWREEY